MSVSVSVSVCVCKRGSANEKNISAASQAAVDEVGALEAEAGVCVLLASGSVSLLDMQIHTYIHTYMCACVCMCEWLYM